MKFRFGAPTQAAIFPAVTVLEIIQRGTEFFTRKGIASPRLEMELLLAHVLHMPRLKLYLNFDRPLMEPELETLRAMVKRRGDREPLQHIVGATSFCGLELAVSPAALIPRPETELLAERAWQHLAQRNGGTEAKPRVLDWGTGSGCLAIAIAVHCPQAEVYATDVSAAALDLARQNAAKHQMEGRIQFTLGDGFQPLPTELSFDLLVSNPPYIPTAEIDSLQPEVRQFDPRKALDGGLDGLDFYRRLALEAPPHLAPGGVVMLEFGDGQAPALRTIFEDQNWVFEDVAQDYSGRERLCVLQRNDKR